MSMIRMIAQKKKTPSVIGVNTAPSIDGLIYQGADPVNIYDGFPWPDILPDGSIITGWKSSPDHASGGPYMLARSVNGGADVQVRQITVGGVAIECFSLGLKRVGNRVLINYQDDPNYNELKFAWINATSLINNFATATFTFAGAYSIGTPTTYSSAPFGKMIVLPSGKILQPFYKFPVDGTSPSVAQFFETTNNGSSWDYGNVIASHNNHTYNAFPDGLFSEVTVLILDGTTDDNTRMVALLRKEIGSNAGYTGCYHYRTSDGGQTWERQNVQDNPGAWDRRIFYPMYDPEGSETNLPCHTYLHGEDVYIFAGVRRLTEHSISYIKATKTEFWENNRLNYDAQVKVVFGGLLGAGYDWGYPEAFIDYYGKLVVQYYDVLSNPPKRVGWFQKVITP